jgi:hypothetical protein
LTHAIFKLPLAVGTAVHTVFDISKSRSGYSWANTPEESSPQAALSRLRIVPVLLYDVGVVFLPFRVLFECFTGWEKLDLVDDGVSQFTHLEIVSNVAYAI